MNHPIRLKTIAPPLFMTLTLLCFGLSPTARALLPPPAPDGGYPGGNTAEGDNALHDVNTAVGINNTAVGANALTHDTTGSYNVAIGGLALGSNTIGQQNMAIGAEALANNLVGNFNMAIGFRALFMNTGFRNSAVGAAALRNNEGASDNTAIGSNALRENTIGEDNTAIGADALHFNIDGASNTAIGFQALFNNTTNSFQQSGDDNTAVGFLALTSNTTGLENTAVGSQALMRNTDAGGNTAYGFQALFNHTGGNNNTAVGGGALFNNTSGTGNIALGVVAGQSLVTGDHNIYIGNNGASAESNTTRIGNGQAATFISGIHGVTTGLVATAVVIDANGQLGTVSSSRRFKDEIKPMDQTSEAILGLKPVTFHYKSDSTKTPQFGLIAEEVAQVNPDLIVRDENGEIYTVRYDAVNAMLLNEFLKEHRTLQELESTVAKQEATIVQQKKDFQAIASQQQKQIEALSAGLQRMSAQLEASKPAPQVVNNP